MSIPGQSLNSHLGSLDAALSQLAGFCRGYPALARTRADLAAAQFHLNRPANAPPLVAILGGTGTGKSTLLNRLLGISVTATSVRRTFTAGPIAVTSSQANIPEHWLGLDRVVLDSGQLPGRGQPDLLSIIIAGGPLSDRLTLIDTPDLDGDQRTHHAQADRVFRWADAVIYLVTPEKYQMTELLPYYRMAQRYGVPTIHVMNKGEEQAVVDDFRRQIESQPLYILARDDSGYSPPSEMDIQGLRSSLASTTIHHDERGCANRVADLLDRVQDQVMGPMQAGRREIDRLVHALRALEAPAPGVDVNPLTQQLQRRLQQRSVLYLMGPGRMLDRVRQVPSILARLPRSTFDLLRTGKLASNGREGSLNLDPSQPPSFHAALVDQFRLLHSRIDDLLRASPLTLPLTDLPDYSATKLDPDIAGKIADDEIAKLQKWLEEHWNAMPRDTAILHKLLKLLPGGQKLTQWSEAAPYLLAVVVATHHAFFGHVDLMILGAYSLATWLTEKVSNEVAARAKQANTAISARFTELIHQQLGRTCAWLDEQAPSAQKLRSMAACVNKLALLLEHANERPAQATR